MPELIGGQRDLPKKGKTSAKAEITGLGLKEPSHSP